MMLSNDDNPKVVQKMPGHSTITQRMDTYSHVPSDLQEQAASRLGSLFSCRALSANCLSRGLACKPALTAFSLFCREFAKLPDQNANSN
jgi:hypothetical protein